MEFNAQIHDRSIYSGGNTPSTHLLEDWVDTRVGLDHLGKRILYFSCRELNFPNCNLLTISTELSRVPLRNVIYKYSAVISD